MQRTSIQLSRQAFNSNIIQIQKAAGQSQVAVVVKSNAYGHGIREIAQMAQEHELVTWLCTVGVQEALILRQNGITKSIIVLSYLDGNLDEAVDQGIHLTVSSYEDALALNAAAQRTGKKAFIHLKIDTGMSRLGILPKDALSFIRAVEHLDHVVLYGIFTHLCDAPNTDQRFSYQQLNSFDELLDMLEAAGISIPCTHALSSSALCIRPSRNYTFIRAGAGAYGLTKSDTHSKLLKAAHPDYTLMPVLEWKTIIIGIKRIEPGATVGYDRTFVAQRPTLLALAPIGYYDGYLRSQSNRGYARIGNHLAPVAGIVSMNLTAFDITDIPEVKLHDPIILIGSYPPLTATDCARSAHIITNEIVTHLNPLIERTIVEAHQPSTVALPLGKRDHITPLF